MGLPLRISDPTPDQLHPNLQFPDSQVVFRYRTFEKPYFLTLVFKVGYTQEAPVELKHHQQHNSLWLGPSPGNLISLASGLAWALGVQTELVNSMST